MDNTLVEIAAKALKVSIKEAQDHCRSIPGDNAFYFWNPVRGGLAVIVGANGEKLGAASSVSFERHLAAFRGGKRN